VKLSQRQIWLVNFDPSVGSEYRKIRPALIITASEYIDNSNLITMVPISSVIEKKRKLDILIRKSINNRLMKDSLIKTFQISTFDKKRLIKFIGTCKEENFNKVKQNISEYLSL